MAHASVWQVLWSCHKSFIFSELCTRRACNLHKHKGFDTTLPNPPWTLCGTKKNNFPVSPSILTCFLAQRCFTSGTFKPLQMPQPSKHWGPITQFPIAVCTLGATKDTPHTITLDCNTWRYGRFVKPLWCQSCTLNKAICILKLECINLPLSPLFGNRGSLGG